MPLMLIYVRNFVHNIAASENQFVTSAPSAATLTIDKLKTIGFDAKLTKYVAKKHIDTNPAVIYIYFTVDAGFADFGSFSLSGTSPLNKRFGFLSNVTKKTSSRVNGEFIIRYEANPNPTLTTVTSTFNIRNLPYVPPPLSKKNMNPDKDRTGNEKLFKIDLEQQINNALQGMLELFYGTQP